MKLFKIASKLLSFPLLFLVMYYLLACFPKRGKDVMVNLKGQWPKFHGSNDLQNTFRDPYILHFLLNYEILRHDILRQKTPKGT